MNITVRKDTILISLNTLELSDVGARNGMMYRIHLQIQEDEKAAHEQGKATYLSRRAPISYYTHQEGQVHVLRILAGFWPYFKDVQPSGPWEQQIREEVVALGLSGKADELAAHYTS